MAAGDVGGCMDYDIRLAAIVLQHKALNA